MQVLVFHSSRGLVVLLLVEVSISHSDTLHSVGLFWKRFRPVAETSTWQHTTLTKDSHAPGGSRTYSPSKRVAAGTRFKQRATGIGLRKVLYALKTEPINLYKVSVNHSPDVRNHIPEDWYFQRPGIFFKICTFLLWPTEENQLYVIRRTWQGKVFSTILA
jgi:hypothetical protein